MGSFWPLQSSMAWGLEGHIPCCLRSQWLVIPNWACFCEGWIWGWCLHEGAEDIRGFGRSHMITSKSWWTCQYHLSSVWSLCTESNELSTCYLALLLSLLTVPLMGTLVVTPCWFGACILAAVFERGSWTGIPSKEVGHELSPYNPYNPLDSHPLSLFFELLQVYCEFSHAPMPPMHARGH